jgi:hypothetical protein
MLPVGPERMLSVAGPNDVRNKWASRFFPTNSYSFKYYLSKKSVINFEVAMPHIVNFLKKERLLFVSRILVGKILLQILSHRI